METPYAQYLTCLTLLLIAGTEAARYHFISSTSSLSLGAAPPSPVSGAWFRDRYTAAEWNTTLEQFRKVGGDTVILRAPPMTIRTKEEIVAEPDYRWCGTGKTGGERPADDCVSSAEDELADLGLNVQAFATFDYEEEYGDSFLLCPKYDKVINGSRIYHRIVLPLIPFNSNEQDQCDLPEGTEVLVLFTSFAGIDPHQLLLQAAQAANMSVYLALPGGAPVGATAKYLPAYYRLIDRYLDNHQSRYTAGPQRKSSDTRLLFKQQPGEPMRAEQTDLYGVITGYFMSDEIDLPTLSAQSEFLNTLSITVHKYRKELGASAFPVLTRAWGNHSVEQHVIGLEMLRISEFDVVAVQDGRGEGRSVAFYQSEVDLAIRERDPELWTVLQRAGVPVSANVSFGDVFVTSTQILFEELQKSLAGGSEPAPVLWISVGGVEMLPGDPCLPLDRKLSGRGQLARRAALSSVIKSIAAGAAHVGKVIGQAWDPDFTCRTREHPTSLAHQLSSSPGPIIANCSWHSPQNMSIVLIGFNLDGLTQAFTIRYHTADGKEHVESQHGYYFELDYGVTHALVRNLMYTQLYDLYDIADIRPHGAVHVQASNHSCTFSY